MFRLSCCIIVVLSLAGCRPDSSKPAASPGAGLASAGAVVDSFLISLGEPSQPAAATRLDTADFVWARSGALLDRDSLASWLGAQRAARTAIILGTSDVKVTPVGTDAAVWSGIVSGVVRDSTGAERQVRGALTLVLRRRGADWVIAAGHESVRPYEDTHEAASTRAR